MRPVAVAAAVFSLTALGAAAAGAKDRDRDVYAPFGLNEIVVSEHNELRDRFRGCWRVPATTQRLDFNVHVRVSFNADGSVDTARIVDYAWITAEPYRLSIARSAQRAVKDRRCNPLPLPDGAREKGGRVTLTFNPKAIFGR